MKPTSNIICLLTTLALAFFLASCSEDFQSDIDRLNSENDKIEERISRLESQVAQMNNQLSQLALLGAAVEQGFYITQVNTTSQGYTLTFSNGHTIVLQQGSDNALVPMPAVSMTQLNGFFYWTLSGQLLTDQNGQPIRVTSQKPIVKYDFQLHQWVISIDGGATFQDISNYSGIILNDVVLLDIINNYISQNQTTLISQSMLYSVISSYIQSNYLQLFNVEILNEIVANYIKVHYTQLFSYELLETIFTQYDFSYYTDQIDVDVLVQAIITFIQEHEEIFQSNEVLFEIVNQYIEVNQTSIFKDELLLELVNNFFDTHTDYLNVELLTQLVSDYISQHSYEVFNTETIKTLMIEYVEKYYTQIFNQQILVQALNIYLTTNQTTIFNQTLIDEVLSNYLQNNFTTIISQQTVFDIVNNYLQVNSNAVFNLDILVEIVSQYFECNYELFIDRTQFSEIINTYIQQNQFTFIDTNIVSNIIYTYLETYYREVFTYDFVSQFVVNYINQNQQTFFQNIVTGNDPIHSVIISDDACIITLANGETIQLVVYDALARLCKRVQSIVVIPNANGNVDADKSHKSLSLRYIVSPASMTSIIVKKCYYGEMAMELLLTDSYGNITKAPISEPSESNGYLLASTSTDKLYAAVALHIKETDNGGSDIITDFTPIEYSEAQHGNLNCPDTNHPHLIDLGLPSGTQWACCNIGASYPYSYGNYYAWGELQPKSSYNWSSYKYGSWYEGEDIGPEISGTENDTAMENWGSNWSMPTAAQYEELLTYCSYELTTMGNVYGLKFTGNNGGSIFLPAAGCYWDTDLKNAGNCGAYWTSTLYADGSDIAYILYFNNNNNLTFGFNDYSRRCTGNSIRPVQYTGN